MWNRRGAEEIEQIVLGEIRFGEASNATPDPVDWWVYDLDAESVAHQSRQRSFEAGLQMMDENFCRRRGHRPGASGAHRADRRGGGPPHHAAEGPARFPIDPTEPCRAASRGAPSRVGIFTTRWRGSASDARGENVAGVSRHRLPPWYRHPLAVSAGVAVLLCSLAGAAFAVAFVPAPPEGAEVLS
jgi:hypothetical protein